MNVRDHLSPEELQAFTRRSDLAGAVTVAFNWGLIALAFALVALRPGVLTVLVSLVLLGGRQLGLAILMHDCAHRSLFRTPWLNEWVGKWLCGAPILADLAAYRKYHFVHHRTAGSDEDPDRSNYLPYPVGRASMRRKLARDLTGITGVKTLYLVLAMSGGLIAYQLSYERKPLDQAGRRWYHVAGLALRNLAAPLLVNVLLASILALLGYASVYLLWPAAWLTTYMAFSRLRNASEHGAVPDPWAIDPLRNTRTTLPRWWERLTIAPNHVNYHLEHHLLPSVPPHRLADLHACLKSRGVYGDAEIVEGYSRVFAKLTAEPAQAKS
ncbi:MAG: fatty acid desaturase family protein [Pseudomonadota bacterium]